MMDIRKELTIVLKEWNNTSAFFNGNAVDVEFYVNPMDEDVFIKIEEVIAGTSPDNGIAIESICGTTDDRIPSQDPRVGRLLSVDLSGGCTGWLLETGLIVTAGHCITQDSYGVLQFNVPESLSDGTIQHPSPEYQYSANQQTIVYEDGNVGDDWAVFQVYNNSVTDLTPLQAQGESFEVIQDISPSILRVTGYGVSGPSPYFGNPPPRNSYSQTQQTDDGSNVGSSGSIIRHRADTQPASSGSPIIDESSGSAIGVHTHGGCTATGGFNRGTSTLHQSFWDSINHPGLVYVDIDGPQLVEMFTCETYSLETNYGTGDFSYDWTVYDPSTNPISGGSSETYYFCPVSPGVHIIVAEVLDNETGLSSEDQMLVSVPDEDGDPIIRPTVEDMEDVPVPDDFAVYDNYPNPFNPVTTIRYELLEPSQVTLIIYDMMGREVRRLVNDVVETGYHTATWDSRNNAGAVVSSGMYLYRFTATPAGSESEFTGITESNTMLLVK